MLRVVRSCVDRCCVVLCVAFRVLRAEWGVLSVALVFAVRSRVSWLRVVDRLVLFVLCVVWYWWAARAVRRASVCVLCGCVRVRVRLPCVCVRESCLNDWLQGVWIS